MKSKLNLLIAVAALMSASVAMADQMNPNHVPGESLDAGISAALTPAHVLHHVPGESLDAGIAPARVVARVAGEKLDSGLGSVTQEEIRRIVNQYAPMTIASSK